LLCDGRRVIPIGTRVSGHVVTEHLGTGGMGAAYAALDERLGRKVALEAIRHARRLDAETQARSLREAWLLSQLDPPNACRIYGSLSDHAKVSPDSKASLNNHGPGGWPLAS
jgi:serine/threonine protein kinase